MSKFLTTWWIEILGAIGRAFPWPAKTGIIRIGTPNRDAPVFITGNYRVTVERVKRALQGLDCYLLVANSHGINVWCAAAGGHFTHHSVISALKTSGIEELVDHRTVVLPQLAATGIEAKLIRKKTGWRVLWGPVYAKDIHQFVQRVFQKTPEMRVTRFPWQQRLEMAVMWAAPMSLLWVPLGWLFARNWLLPVFLLIWGFSLAIFALFPFYVRWLHPTKKSVSPTRWSVFFDLGRGPVLIWFGVFILFTFFAYMSHNLSFHLLLRWGIASGVILLLLNIDLMGSTPIYKSTLHEDRLLSISLDLERCKGAGFCVEVCPRNCYILDSDQRKATWAHPERCIQCGACIVQCPFDAIYFVYPSGEKIPPDVIRTYRLNLLGKREVRVHPS